MVRSPSCAQQEEKRSDPRGRPDHRLHRGTLSFPCAVRAGMTSPCPLQPRTEPDSDREMNIHGTSACGFPNGGPGTAILPAVGQSARPLPNAVLGGLLPAMGGRLPLALAAGIVNSFHEPRLAVRLEVGRLTSRLFAGYRHQHHLGRASCEASDVSRRRLGYARLLAFRLDRHCRRLRPSGTREGTKRQDDADHDSGSSERHRARNRRPARRDRTRKLVPPIR